MMESAARTSSIKNNRSPDKTAPLAIGSSDYCDHLNSVTDELGMGGKKAGSSPSKHSPQPYHLAQDYCIGHEMQPGHDFHRGRTQYMMSEHDSTWQRRMFHSSMSETRAQLNPWFLQHMAYPSTVNNMAGYYRQIPTTQPLKTDQEIKESKCNSIMMLDLNKVRRVKKKSLARQRRP